MCSAIPIIKFVRVVQSSLYADHLSRILKCHFDEEKDGDWGSDPSRGYACEFIAWQVLLNLPFSEAIVHLLSGLRPMSDDEFSHGDLEGNSILSDYSTRRQDSATEGTPLLVQAALAVSKAFGYGTNTCKLSSRHGDTQRHSEDDEIYAAFYGQNALEIAIIAHAKDFLSQKAVQHVINAVWRGDVILWNELSVHAWKKPQLYNER